jgi:hypothetical protein
MEMNGDRVDMEGTKKKVQNELAAAALQDLFQVRASRATLLRDPQQPAHAVAPARLSRLRRKSRTSAS